MKEFQMAEFDQYLRSDHSVGARRPAGGGALRQLTCRCGPKMIAGMVLLLVTLVSVALAQTAERPIRIIAYGDDESLGGRLPRGLGFSLPNPFMPKLFDELWRQADDIDLILHSGDFVRMGPPPQRYRDELRRDDPARLWKKFFPTGGGDQEYCEGRFAAFFELAEHLGALPHRRDTCQGRDGREHLGYYYHLERRIRGQRLAVVVLHNPDQYDRIERKRYCGAQAACDPISQRNAQHRWVEGILRQTRAADRPGDRAFIVLLSHRPLTSAMYRTNHMRPLLSRYRVNLVISGDKHVYARKVVNGSLHVITGVAGDFATGGCHTTYLDGFDRCLPEAKHGYVLGFSQPALRYDHYLDVHIHPDHFTIAPTRLDGTLIEGPLRFER